MLNPVATPNILLSTSIKALESAISAKSASDPDSSIFVNVSESGSVTGDHIFSSKNTNFISLEHTFGNGKFFGIKLKIQDPTTTLIDVLHAQKNEVAALSGLDQADFFLTYGLGPNATSHWAGPFVCQVLHFRNYTTAGDIEIIEVEFVSNLPMVAQQSLRTLTDTRMETNMFTAPPVPKYSTNPTGLGMQATQKIGNAAPSVKGYAWDFPTQDVIDSIRKLYTNYAGTWAMPNFMMFISKEFKTAFDNFVKDSSFSTGNSRTLLPSTPLSDVKIFLASFGLDLVLVSKSATVYQPTAPLPGQGFISSVTQAPGTSVNYMEVYISIERTLLEGSNFFAVLDAFYQGLSTWSDIPFSHTVLVENNTILTKSLKEDSLQAEVFTDTAAPLVVVGEEALVKQELYGIIKTNSLTALPEEEWGVVGWLDSPLQEYFLNKIHRRAKKHYYQELYSKSETFDYKDDPPGVDSDPGEILFEANTPGSNILSYTFDTNVFTLAAIKVNFNELDATKEDILKYATETLKGLVKNQDMFEIDAVADTLSEYISKQAKANKPATGPTVATSSPKLWKDAVGRYIRYFYKVALSSGYTGTIRTLPHFQLSDQFMVGQVVRIQIQRTPTSDTYSLTDLPAETFYNGMYKVIGFKHFITSTEAYSEFEVIKMEAPDKLNQWSKSSWAKKQERAKEAKELSEKQKLFEYNQ